MNKKIVEEIVNNLFGIASRYKIDKIYIESLDKSFTLKELGNMFLKEMEKE